jgi:hypothetical protein
VGFVVRKVALGYEFLLIQCFRKVAVHLQNLLEMMSTSVYTDLSPFNVIRKLFRHK